MRPKANVAGDVPPRFKSEFLAEQAYVMFRWASFTV